jgi:hypothetical protein
MGFIDSSGQAIGRSTAESSLHRSTNDIHPLHLVLITGMQSLSSNTIQIPSATLCNTSPASLLILFQHPNLLKSLQYLALNTPASIKVAARTGSTILAAAMDSAKSAYTNRFA